MARKIRFALKVKDDFEARNIDELREHFDLEAVLAYFSDGKLQTWLEDRYYDDEAEAVENLSKDDSELEQKLCQILGVDYEEFLDPEEIERRNERLKRLKQYTTNPEFIKKVNLVAFDQEDLADLLDEDQPEIYLCQNKFTIPLRKRNKKYIGIGEVEVVIRSKEKVDFEALNIEFENVKFNSEYEKLLNESVDYPMGLAKKEPDYAEDTHESSDMQAEDYIEDNESEEDNIDWYIQQANRGDHEAIGKLAKIYYEQKNYEEAIKWCKKAVEYGDSQAANILGLIYEEDFSRFDLDEALKWFKKSYDLDKNNIDSVREIDGVYDILERTDEECIDWYLQQANRGYHVALGKLAEIYYKLKDYEDAIKWCRKAVEYEDSQAANILGHIYEEDDSRFDLDEAIEWFKKSYAFDKENTDSLKAIVSIYDILGDRDEALRFLMEKADDNDSCAMNEIGEIYWFKEDNTEEAAKWFRRAVDVDRNIDAMENLGCVYHHCFERYQEAFDCYKQVLDVDGSRTSTLNNMGWLYYNGQGVSRDVYTAICYFKQAVECCYVNAMYALGYIYDTEYNFYHAMYWYLQAANNGHDDAAYKVGQFFEYGRYVKEDITRAIPWYIRAAKNGSEDAMTKLDEYSELVNAIEYHARRGNDEAMTLTGDIYYTHEDYDTAMNWYLEAADRDNIEAIKEIADMYRYGIGVEIDPDKAEAWDSKEREIEFQKL